MHNNEGLFYGLKSAAVIIAMLAVALLLSIAVQGQQPASVPHLPNKTAQGTHSSHSSQAAQPTTSAQAAQAAPSAQAAQALPDSIPVGAPLDRKAVVVEDAVALSGDSLYVTPVDTLGVLTAGEAYEADSLARASRNADIIRSLKSIPEEEWVPREVEFNPDPTRAVWLSALFPGLGQVYNRRYWKLPLIVGGYLGLGYATSWNNQMLKDYTRAYADLLDNDPGSNSYMDFFAPNVKESDIDKNWLQNVMRSRKNYFRRNRDLCIISMVGVYLLAMVDAYVDASLSHFDISPRLSMDVAPAIMQDGRQRYPSVGLAWALNF